jgi:hypothetical protein
MGDTWDLSGDDQGAFVKPLNSALPSRCGYGAPWPGVGSNLVLGGALAFYSHQIDVV